MFLIVGYVIILASALGTYAVHGSLLALWVPLEYIAIIGLMIGYFVASNNIGLIKATACEPSAYPISMNVTEPQSTSAKAEKANGECVLWPCRRTVSQKTEDHSTKN